MQLLARMMDYVLAQRGDAQRSSALHPATTGGAAIEAPLAGATTQTFSSCSPMGGSRRYSNAR